MDWSQFVIALGSLGTFGTVLILAYIEIIRPWLNAPQLKIDFEQKEPYCKEIGWIFKDSQGNIVRTPSYWIRIKVTNIGSSVAENCYGQLTEIIDHRKGIVENFVPLILRWSSRPSIDPIDIVEETSWFLDIIHINKDNNKVRGIFGSTYSNKAHICEIYREQPTGTKKELRTGKYTLKIMVYGDNIKPVKKELYVNWGGNWKAHGRDSIIVKMK